MSIRVMSRVWDDQSITDHGELLVLLAISDYANDAAEAWPSVHQVALKTRCSDRGVQKIITRLIANGKLELLRSGGGRDRNLYRVTGEPGSPQGRTPFTPGVNLVTPPNIRNRQNPSKGNGKLPPFERIELGQALNRGLKKLEQLERGRPYPPNSRELTELKRLRIVTEDLKGRLGLEV